MALEITENTKTLFEKQTLVVVLIMLFVTLAGIFATALELSVDSKQAMRIETTNDWVLPAF